MFHRTSAYHSHLKPGASFTTYPGAVSATMSGICSYFHITVKALAFTVLWLNQPLGHRHCNFYQPFLHIMLPGMVINLRNSTTVVSAIVSGICYSKSYITVKLWPSLFWDSSSIQQIHLSKIYFPSSRIAHERIVTCSHLYQFSTGHYVLDMLNIFISQS